VIADLCRNIGPTWKKSPTQGTRRAHRGPILIRARPRLRWFCFLKDVPAFFTCPLLWGGIDILEGDRTRNKQRTIASLKNSARPMGVKDKRVAVLGLAFKSQYGRIRSRSRVGSSSSACSKKVRSCMPLNHEGMPRKKGASQITLSRDASQARQDADCRAELEPSGILSAMLIGNRAAKTLGPP